MKKETFYEFPLPPPTRVNENPHYDLLCPLAQHPDTHFLGDTPPPAICLLPQTRGAMASASANACSSPRSLCSPAAPRVYLGAASLVPGTAAQPGSLILRQGEQSRGMVMVLGGREPPFPRDVNGRREAPPEVEALSQQCPETMGSCEAASERENKSRTVYHLWISQ